jgi:hypothetical protein
MGTKGKRTSISSRSKSPRRESRSNPTSWTCYDRHCVCERRQWSVSVNNTQAVISAVNGIAVAVSIVDLVDDLVASFGPEAETFDGDAVDEGEIVTNEAYGRTFGAVG